MRCSATKKDGTPCTLAANGPDGLCWVHSPTNTEARRRGQSRGGSGNKETRRIKHLMDELTSKVLEGELEPSVVHAVVALMNIKLRTIELERRLAESDVLVEFENLKSVLAEHGVLTG